MVKRGETLSPLGLGRNGGAAAVGVLAAESPRGVSAWRLLGRLSDNTRSASGLRASRFTARSAVGSITGVRSSFILSPCSSRQRMYNIV